MNVSGTMNSATGHTSVSTRTGNFSDGLYDRAGARPDLDLDFARTKSLKDRVSKEEIITFSRGASRIRGTTYVDENGLVKTAGHNIVRSSHQIGDITWTKTSNFSGGSNLTYTLNTTETTAPNGMFEATKFVMDSGTTASQLTCVNNGVPSSPWPLLDNDSIIFSVYLKSATNSNQIIQLSVSGTSRGRFTVTPEWQRFAVRAKRTDAAHFSGRIGVRNCSGSCSNHPQSDGSFVNQHVEFYAWGAQIEFDGTTLDNSGPDGYTGPIGELVRTGTSGGSGAPRFTHDPETYESKGLLIEQAATNVSINSEDFTHLTPNHATLTQNAGTAPDGTNTAVKLSPNSNTSINRHIVEKNFTVLRDESAKTGSVWVKADPDGNGRYVQFGWAAPSGQAYLLSTFDTETGQVTDQQNTGTTGGGGFLEATPYPNGWYRLRVTSTDTGGNVGFLKVGLAKYPTHAATQAAQPGNAAVHGSQKFVGDAAEHSILIWGHQAETGAVATSYIPTSGSEVTRSADIASIEGDNFGTYRQNILPNTQPYNVTYTTSSGSTYLADATRITLDTYVAVSPDGNYNASLITENNESGVHELQNTPEITLLNDTTYTVSCHVKEPTNNSRRYIGLAMHGRGIEIFDIQNGTHHRTTSSAGMVSRDITPVGNGWYRISMVCTSLSNQNATTRNHVYIILDNGGTNHQYQGDGVSGMYVWGVQVEQGNTLTEYIPSTDTYTSRTSNATFVDGNGIIRTAHRNLIPYSEEFGVDDTGSLQRWQNGNVQLSYDANHINPDGTTGTFYGNTYTAGNSEREIYRYFPGNEANTDTLTFSLFCKKKDANSTTVHIQVFVSVGDATYGTDSLGVCSIFHPPDGTFVEPPDGYSTSGGNSGRIITNQKAEDYGNGWWRMSFTVQLNGDSNQSPIFTAGSRFDIQNLHQCYIWGAQVVKGTEVGDYYKTTGTASGPPRYSYDPETLTPTGLYLEPAATNLIPYSEDFTQNAWDKDQTTVTANATTAPDGTNTATLVTIDHSHGHGSHRVRDPGHNLGPHQYTFSVFVKAGTTDSIALQMYKTGVATILNKRFFLSDGTVGNTGTGTAKITKYPDGWYRLEGTTIPDTNTASTSTVIIIHKDATSNANYEVPNDGSTVSAYLWGAQLEQSNSSTSYIPTSGAEATRNADIFTSTATEVLDRANGTKPAFFTRNGVSVFVGLKLNNQKITPTTSNAYSNSHTYNGVINLSQSNTSILTMMPDLYASWTTPPEPRLVVFTGSPTDIFLANNYTEDADLKAALRFKENDSQFATNAALYDGIGGGDTSVAIESPNILKIGRNASSTKYLNGIVNRLTFWKTPFVDRKLQRLTS